MGVAKPGETRGLTGTGPGLARQESACPVFGRVWNRTYPFLPSKPGPFANTTQRWENSAALCKVLPCGADLAAPLSPQSYAKPKFMGPQNRRDGKHADDMIKDFRALLTNTEDATHHAAIYSGTREFIKHKSRNNMYISDAQLHTMVLCIYHGIRVQVEGLDGERISQICRCTGSRSWSRGDRRNDWVWVKHRPGRCYGALNGRLPWPLQ